MRRSDRGGRGGVRRRGQDRRRVPSHPEGGVRSASADFVFVRRQCAQFVFVDRSRAPVVASSPAPSARVPRARARRTWRHVPPPSRRVFSGDSADPLRPLAAPPSSSPASRDGANRKRNTAPSTPCASLNLCAPARGKRRDGAGRRARARVSEPRFHREPATAAGRGRSRGVSPTWKDARRNRSR